MGSLVLDILIPALIPAKIPVPLATHLAALLALLTLPFLAQSFIHGMLSKLRHLHTKTIEGASQTLPLLVTAAVGGIFLVKLFAVARLPGLVATVLAFFLIANAFKYLLHLSRETKADRKLLEENPWVRVQRWEHQLIIFATVPLILARLIGVCGGLADIPEEDYMYRLAFTGISALFLAMLRPERSLFMGICKGCKQPVPIAFRDLGCCLNCSLPLRVAFHRWAHRVAAPIEEQELLKPADKTPPPGSKASTSRNALLEGKPRNGMVPGETKRTTKSQQTTGGTKRGAPLRRS